MTRQRGWSGEDLAALVIVIAAALAVAGMLSGCGGSKSALEMHASSALAMRTVIDGAADTIEMERERAQHDAIEAADTEAEARASVAAIRESWAIAIEAHALAVAVWQAWIDALVLADAADDAEGLHFLARTLADTVRAYARLAEVVIDAGGPRLPALPAVVAALIGGDS